MANRIIPKRSSVAAKIPLAADLSVGELAVNLADGVLYSKDAGGNIISLGGGGGLPSQTSNSGKFLTTNGTIASWASITASTIGLGNVENKSSATIRSELTSTNVTTALGFTPYNSTNPNGFISGITSGMVTTALGYTPYNSSNPNGYTTNTGTVTSVGGTGTVSGLTLTGTVTGSGNLTLGGTLTLTSANVTTALGYTPYSINGAAPTDLNTAASGVYRINTGHTNQPSDTDYGTLLSFDNSADTGFQLASDYGGSNFYWRSGNAAIYGGSGSFGAWRKIIHDGNYTSYAPSLTGSGASGSWGISVTGAAKYLTGANAFTNGSDGWWRSNGAAGVYYNSYGRGIFPPDGTVSYGNNTIYGSGLNGWTGWSVNNSNNCILMSNGSQHGLYNPVSGVWIMLTSDAVGSNTTFYGNVTAYSDLRLKENVRDIDNVVERRNALAEAAIKYERDGRTRIGYGAQTLRENGCGEFVHEADDDAYKLATGTGILSVDYGETAAVLAVASKLTDDRVEVLEDRIVALEKFIKEKLQ